MAAVSQKNKMVTASKTGAVFFCLKIICNIVAFIYNFTLIMNGIDYKAIPIGELTLKNIDEAQGRIQGYFSTFGNVDADKEMVMPGAFQKTLAQNSKRIKHLYQHNPLQPLAGVKNGKLIMTEDKNGLFFDSTISQTSYGKDVIKLYADGVIDEHSIGFNAVTKSEKKNYTELNEIKLWEGSTVTWGANEMAGTSSVKSLTQEEAITKMNVVIKALRNGKYENEDVFDLLEIYFKQLQQTIIDLKKSTMPDMVKCPNCGEQTPSAENAMGGIMCVHCGNTFSTQKSTMPERLKNYGVAFTNFLTH